MQNNIKLCLRFIFTLLTRIVHCDMAGMKKCLICRVLDKHTYVVKNVFNPAIFRIRIVSIMTDEIESFRELKEGDVIGVQLGNFCVDDAIYKNCVVHSPYDINGQRVNVFHVFRKPPRTRLIEQDTVT